MPTKDNRFTMQFLFVTEIIYLKRPPANKSILSKRLTHNKERLVKGIDILLQDFSGF